VSRIAPLEHGEGLTDGEGAGRVLEGDNATLTRSELGNVRVLLELQVGAEVGGRGRKGELDMRASGVGNLKVHVTLDLHRFYAASTHEGS
jgi:hypothetical protein